MPALAHAQSPVTCSSPTATSIPIRNEGQTEQVADYRFTCQNAISSSVNATVTAVLSAPVTSLVVNSGTGATEASIVNRRTTAAVQGTVSGSTVTFSNVAVAGNSIVLFDITNVRIDASGLANLAQVTETVTVSGTSVTTANFAALQVATVQTGISSSITNITNYGAGAAAAASTAAFTMHFGEAAVPNAFKTQGGSGNTALGSWLTNNTETGYFISAGTGNIANAATRVRVVLTNIPAGLAVYAPISIGTDQTSPASGLPIGTAVATATESGTFSQSPPASPQPSGYTGTATLAQIPVSGGNAEVVYEITQDSATTTESYTVPFFITGTVPANAGNTSATVSFAPVNVGGIVPIFAQLSASSAALNASQFSLNITTTILPMGEVGLAYSPRIVATGGSPLYTFSVVTGSIAGLGLSLNGLTGQISGPPTSPGTVNVTIGVTDATNAFTANPFTIQIAQTVSINNASLPNGAVNEAYSSTLAASNGYAPYTWSVSSGSLPSGLTLVPSSGLISGAPTAANTYNFSITVTDAMGVTATRPYTVVINPLLGITTTSANIRPGVQGLAYIGATAMATGGSAGYSYSVTSGLAALTAAGMTFNASGQLGGTPNTTGSINFQITVTDQGGGSATTGTLTLNLNPPISFTTTTLPSGEVGVPYTTQLVVTGGSGQYNNWLVFSGSLPAGSPAFSVSNTGVISGTPTAGGAAQFQIRVYDAVYNTVFVISGQLTIVVNLAPSISTTLLPAGEAGSVYPATTVVAGGGTGPYTFTATGLPSGISITPAGLVSGTPTTAGTYTVMVTATDSLGGTASQTYTVVIDTPGTVITTNLLPGMAIVNLSGTTYGAANSSGTNQSFWSGPFATSGPLLEYTVPAGTHTLRAINATDAAAIFPNLTNAQLSTIFSAWTYNSPYTTAYLAFDASAATNSSQTQLFSGAESGNSDTNTPPAFSQPVCAGAVTNGVAFTPACAYAAFVSAGWYREIHNGPTGRYGPDLFGYTFTSDETLIFAVPDYALSDNGGGVSILIAPLAFGLGITTTSLPSGQQGTAYSAPNMAGTGGNGIYSWSATGLPPGISLSAAGAFSGTPTASGTFSSVVVTVTDQISGSSAMQTYSIAISAPPAPLSITTTSLPNGYVNGTYNATVMATGGNGTRTFTVSAGALPNGLNLTAASGQISGTPASTGSFTFTIRVLDNASAVATQQFTVVISPTLFINSGLLPDAVEQLNYNQTLTASGGSGGPYTWSLATGSLPSGLTLNGSGAITGIPINTVAQRFEPQVTDSNGNTRLVSLVITVDSSPVSFVLVNQTSGGLVRVSADGTSVTPINSTVNGLDVKQDVSGNFIVTSGSSVQRVTPSGTVATIAAAPMGAHFAAVAVDAADNIIVVDNAGHQLFRISPDGQSVISFATYPVPNPGQQGDNCLLVDVHGNYILAQDNGGVSLFSITPSGTVTPIALTGSPLPASVGGLTFDQNGNYILQDYSGQAVFSITPAGAVTQFATGDQAFLGIAQNPLTGLYVLGSNTSNRLYGVNAHGSLGAFSVSSTSLTNPEGIVAQTTDFVSSAIATSPLGYFRLEAISGQSEVGANTYLASTPSSTVQSPGAPITTPGNKAIALNGSTDQITTNLTGGINTAGSMMAWVNLAQLPSSSTEPFFYIAGESQVGNDFDLQFSNANTLGFFTTNGGASLSYTPPQSSLVGQWHMIVATFDATAGARAIYWDGQRVANDTVVSLTNKTTQFNIGATSVFPGRNFNGQIDEVAVWNYALTPGQVYYLYESAGGIGSSETITSLSPATAPVNSSSVTLTVHGVSLTPASIWFTSPNGTTSLIPQMPPVTGVSTTAVLPASVLTTPGVAQITITNSLFGFPTNQLPFTITSGPPLSLTGGTLPGATMGQTYSASVSASGGMPPYTYSATGLPTGITLATTGSFSGSTTQTGSFTVNVQVTDSQSNMTSAMFTLNVSAPAPPPAPSAPSLTLSGSLPAATASEPYSASFSASGGTPPYSYHATGFPSGIAINAGSGAVGGQTAQTGSFTVSVFATDSAGLTSGGSYTFRVSAPLLVSLSGGNLGSFVLGTSVSAPVGASGGTPPYTYTVTSGSLPPGLSLQGGTLSGTPTTAGSYSFTLKVTDSTGGTASASFSISITSPPLTLNAPSPLATGTVSIGYPTQTLSASGGTAPYTFKVTTGALPAGLTLSSTGMITGTPTSPGAASFTVTASDSATTPATGSANLSIAIQPFSQNVVLSAGSLSFSLSAGAAALPPAQSVGVQSTMVNQPINYSVAVQPASASWLSAASGTTTPGSVSVSLTQAALSLAASTTPYTASIVVTCTSGGCVGSSKSASVSLTVSSPPPQLSVQMTVLAFNTSSATPQATTESLGISNTGGGSIGFSSIACGAPWCTVTGGPGSLGAGASATLTVTADPTGLLAGYYFTSVTIDSSAGKATVPVTLTIAANGVISLGPAGAEFTVPQGGQLGQSNSFLVDITGTTPVSYTAAVAPGAPFLQIVNGSGSSSGASPGTVSYAFDNTQVSQLMAGTYYGSIQLTASGAANSPQSYEVVLNVTPSTTPVVPTPTPGGLVFLTQAAAAPSAQTVTVYSFTPAATAFQASATTNSGGNWLSVTPTTGSTTAATPGTVSVTVDPTGLRSGVYRGTVDLAFSATAVRSVNVTLLVKNTASATAPSIISRKDAATGGCTPSQLVPTSTGLVSNFAAPAAWPVPLGITLVDDCGDLVTNGQIVATFSNGDPPLILTLADPTMASYVATWTPQHSAGQITINARATAPSFALATAQILGAVTPNNAPILADLAIANFFNPIGGAPLAPGALVQITGQYLASQTMNAPSIPLPTSLGGTSVIIGGMQAPVSMVSPGQVNAQVPFELPAGQPYQVIVNANSALTTPQSFQAGAASPGLGVLPNGFVQAGHGDGSPVTEKAPAKPGETISVYLVGMGATTIPVPSGQPGPSGTFATTVVSPVLTLNGESTTVSFSGLIPGLVGVYQVNFAVPSDAPNGDLTLSLVQNAFASNSGLLPVHN